ncbi:MAG: hypothetical protein H0X36_14720 [Sphingomonadaceae bacterium]|nr:hypothetical protein [Sphingomonadaceae bacterium]
MTDLAQYSGTRRDAQRSGYREGMPFITCPYCRQVFGPWGRELIEPCQLCERPLHRSIGWTRPRGVVLLLETINTLQGIGMMLAGILFVIGTTTLRGLCTCVALALFASATAYIADGVLAWRTRLSRTFGRILTGSEARAAGAATIVFGLAALLLSFAGLAGFAFLVTQPG